MKSLFVFLLFLCNAWDCTNAAAPTKRPVAYPTLRPTNDSTVSPTAPTPASSLAPSIRPPNESQQLFAVIGAGACAENLHYGPQIITQAGSADGQHPHFLSTNTPSASVSHSDWLQIATSDGTNELFRIYWTFNTPKTLAQRFADAVAVGEKVDYRVELPSGQTYLLNGTWWFSSISKITTSTFDVTTTTCCFSADDGAWSAAFGSIDGGGLAFHPATAWGIGNFDNSDDTCSNVYLNGEVDTSHTNTKVYMYSFDPAAPSAEPTAEPSVKPTIKLTTAIPTMHPTTMPSSAPSTTTPTLAPTILPSLNPTVVPTVVPSLNHTVVPTVAPTASVCTPYTSSNGVAVPCGPIRACPGDTITVGNCGACTGDTFLYLDNAAGMNIYVDDDGCGSSCSVIRYVVMEVEGSACQEYTVRQACSDSRTCAGTTSYTVTPEPMRPTAQPVTSPPTLPLTLSPTTTTPSTSIPTVTDPTTVYEYELFGVVGGLECAAGLHFGKQPISKRGSADGVFSSYMSTIAGNVPHTNWMQVVTSDGVNELFRIHWTFGTAKTVAQRIADAVSTGEHVSYRVVTASGSVYTYSGTWRFSDGADFVAGNFDSVNPGSCCLSAPRSAQGDHYGAWGAGDGVINANGDATAITRSNFWGVGHFEGVADGDCYNIYQGGVLYADSTGYTRVYLYYMTDVVAPPAPAPTASPTLPMGRGSCPPYTSTGGAQVRCGFISACGGDTITVGNCGAGTGDSILYLDTSIGTQVSMNDEGCDDGVGGSLISYTIPRGVICQAYSVRQGCLPWYNSDTCRGTTSYTVTPTAFVSLKALQVRNLVLCNNICMKIQSCVKDM